MNETTLSEITSILRDLNKEKPWMTAKGLSRKIKQRTGRSISPAEIEEFLIAHSNTPGRTVRHSHYPSKRTLDIIWGHTEVVGEKHRLPGLERIDETKLTEDSTLPDDAKWFFISHNYRDFDNALKLRRLLSEQKLGAWLFETDIQKDELIIPAVRESIGQCDFFISFVTRYSLGSLWVGKEWEQAIRNQHCETLIVIDSTDPPLRKLFEEWKPGWPPERDYVETFCANVNIDHPAGDLWEKRCVNFMYRLNECLGNDNLIRAFPNLSRNTIWQGKSLKLENFTDFLMALKKNK